MPRVHGLGIIKALRTQSYLGKSNWAADALLKGTLDDFKVFPRVLHPEEITCLS